MAGIHLIPAPDKMGDTALRTAIDAAQQTKKSISLAQLIAAFGIENAGKSAGKALESHFHSFDKVRAATVEELEAVDDVGTKTAVQIHDYLRDHADEIDDLLQFVEPESPKTGTLSGKTFCFSGGFEAGKRHWEQQVEALGGKCTGTVSKKTDYLVAGSGSGSKTEKAKKLGTPIITVEQLQELL
jgi:DNA ligase (NAD+)